MGIRKGNEMGIRKGNEMGIRKANEKDLDSLLELLHQLSPPSEEDLKEGKEKLKGILRKMLSNEDYFLCVLEREGKILGTGTLFLQLNISHGGKPVAHIENIVVDSAHRKEGVGRKIIDFLVEKAKEKGAYKIILACKKENIPFYEKSGFKEFSVEMRLDLD